MVDPQTFSVKATLAVPREALWSLLADTERLNRAIGLGGVRFVPNPARKGYYEAEARQLGITLAYEEHPFEWVAPRFYRILRKFRRGPILEIECAVRMEPAG